MTSHDDGVLRISDFSNSFLGLFLEKDGVVMPEDQMDAVIAGDDYEKHVILD